MYEARVAGFLAVLSGPTIKRDKCLKIGPEHYDSSNWWRLTDFSNTKSVSE